MEDARGRLGLGGRRELVRLIEEEGASPRSAARRLGVAPASAHRWWQRWQAAGAPERRSRDCLRSRPPRPRSCPWQLGAAEEARILEARARTNLGPARLAGLVGRRRSTVWKVLYRHGVSRRRRSAPERRPARRYEWSKPGALLHVDTKQLAAFPGPGTSPTPIGPSATAAAAPATSTPTASSTIAPARPTSSCTPTNAGRPAPACSGARRAGSPSRGCGLAQAVMSDNAMAHRHSGAFQAALAELGARHILIPPRTPRWNGKVERFIRTLDEEWAHGRVWESSHQRARALLSFLRYYNGRRPHSALGDRPPISRVPQERGQYS